VIEKLLALTEIALWWTDYGCFTIGFSLLRQPNSQMLVSKLLSKQSTDFLIKQV